MVGHPVVLEKLELLVETEHDPARAAAESLADLAEFRLPGVEALERGGNLRA
jgi:hypothetical protein